MPRFYLTTWASSEEGFVPRGADGDWACIDLRPSSTRPDGLALLWCQDAVSSAAFDLGDDPDDRSAARKRGIESRLGLTLDSVDLRAVVLELLLGHARTDGSRWRPLRANRRQRRYEVWLGPLLAALPVAAGGAVITESFNTADGSTLGPDLTWAEVVGNWAISSNTASVPTNNNCSARAEHDLDTDDHYAQVDVSWLNAASRQHGTAVRFFATGTGGSSADYYCTRANANGDNVLVQKAVDNSFTTLSSTARTIGVETLTVRTEINGSTLTGIVGGTSYPTTDTEITGNLRTGICGFVPATGEAATYDNFEAGDLSSTVTGAASLTGTGTASAAAFKSTFGAAAVTGIGSHNVSGFKTTAGAAALAGTGSSTTAGVRSTFGVGNLTGSGTLTAAGHRTTTGAAALTGTGTLVASHTGTITGAANLTATGTLTAAGNHTGVGSATLTGSGSQTAAGIRSTFGAVPLTGAGTQTVAGRRTTFAVAAVTGTGTVATVGVRSTFAVGALTGSGTLTAAWDMVDWIDFDAASTPTAKYDGLTRTGGEVNGRSQTGGEVDGQERLSGEVNGRQLVGSFDGR